MKCTSLLLSPPDSILSFYLWLDPIKVLYYCLCHCSSCFRYISILPVIPVTVHLSPQDAIDTRHPQDTRHPPPTIPKVSADLQTDLTLYKSVLTHTYTHTHSRFSTSKVKSHREWGRKLANLTERNMSPTLMHYLLKISVLITEIFICSGGCLKMK